MMTQMNIINRVVLLSLVSISALSAQSLDQLKEKLSFLEADTSSEYARYVNVEIREDESSQRALVALIDQGRDEQSGEPIDVSMSGYRIGVFFDNGASARAEAERVLHLCDSLMADIPATLSYENPYFKVTAGHCITQEEAVMTLHRVQRYFPSAYLMRDEITPANIVSSRWQEVSCVAAQNNARIGRI